MSDQSQQVTEPVLEATEVSGGGGGSGEKSTPDPVEQFTDVEQELFTIVEQRKADKKKERAAAGKASKRQSSVDTTPDDASQESEGAEVGALDAVLVPATETPSPVETQPVAAGQQGQEPPSTTPPSTTPPSDTAEATPFTYRFRDTDFDEQTVQNGLELKAWADSLSPEHQVGINAYLTGEGILISKAEYDRIQKGGKPNEPVGTTPVSDSSSNPPEFSEEDLAELPPAVVAMLRNQQQQLSDVAKWRQEQEQQSRTLAQQQYQQNLRTTIDKVVTEVKTKYALTDAEFKQLDDETGKSGQVARLATAYGDPERALREAFDNNYARIFQAREIARQAAALNVGQAVVTEQKQRTTTRKANAASLNPAGNSVPSGNPRPTTPEEKRQARVAEIQEMMMQGG